MSEGTKSQLVIENGIISVENHPGWNNINVDGSFISYTMDSKTSRTFKKYTTKEVVPPIQKKSATFMLKNV